MDHMSNINKQELEPAVATGTGSRQMSGSNSCSSKMESLTNDNVTSVVLPALTEMIDTDSKDDIPVPTQVLVVQTRRSTKIINIKNCLIHCSSSNWTTISLVNSNYD